MQLSDDDESKEIAAVVEKPDPADPHDTLKYHLLGPSLTKAGQDNVDQQSVSEIIYNASKGSKFFNYEKSRDEVLTGKIQRILAHKEKLEKTDLSNPLRRADEYIAELELGRDLSQTVVHLDCDAFFAAVEELDQPELRNVPMAVGKGVLTTCNYHARKFGVRSGMASFIAKRLCPDLILLPQNYEKYTAKAEEIRDVLRGYDPLFESASIDEAYLNITEYCAENDMDPQQAVQKLRDEVFEKTKLTVSAGIAVNARIAKIASNWNKPNGQFYVSSERSAVMSFMADIPVRKLNGIGRVFERELDAIGVKKCSDIFLYRGILSQLFGQKSFQFLMRCYLGLGRTKIQPAEIYERKSVGTERTFRDIGDMSQLQEQLSWTAKELEKDLAKTEFKGRTLVLKVKLHTFEVVSRQVIPPKAVHLSNDLYHYALPMLTKLKKERPDMKIRLMGLRCTSLVSMKRPDSSFFGPSSRVARVNSPADSVPYEDNFQAENGLRMSESLGGRLLADDSMKYDGDGGDPAQASITELNQVETIASPEENKSTLDAWVCPICSCPQAPDNTSFNAHLDFCLSKQTIKQAVESSLSNPSASPVASNGKRKISSTPQSTLGEARKRPFFG
ncbi:hypothetical protein AJ80_08880 [Polytolypa hystricis UAMH7299]|uniref:DNA polymerase kappa n=1 Tax=Polytolypa hystricis (strain UAMH7299) TaxID=1447883 RepID=A0A2B7WZY4_POLH7|nr:hypothetical protein AJ80_08880 [Polytolypa hystricis UAMH7299]